MHRRLFLAAALASLSAPVLARPRTALEIRDAWVRQPPPGAPTAAGYFTILNHGRTSDRLIGASSPAAARVELHEMSMAGGVMRMRAAGGVAVPAEGSVDLRPGGLHLMLIGPRLTPGRPVPITLRFEGAGELRIVAPVRAPGR